jgi:hypothetical protein
VQPGAADLKSLRRARRLQAASPFVDLDQASLSKTYNDFGSHDILGRYCDAHSLLFRRCISLAFAISAAATRLSGREVKLDKLEPRAYRADPLSA